MRTVTVAGRSYELLGPANYEALVDDSRVIERFAEDEYLPYWAEFWPACLILADVVVSWPEATDPVCAPRVLELGCGLGLPSLIAAQRGYRVLASDYDDDALAFVRASARRNGIPPPATRCIDWRKRYDDLRFERILAAEVLYERRNLRPVARFVRRHLAADGLALICDANRSIADEFESIAASTDLAVRIRRRERHGPAPSPPVRGRIFELRHE